jgi:hypothetical protein
MRHLIALSCAALATALLVSGTALAQAQPAKPQEEKAAPDPLKTAKTIFVKQSGGSDIPFNVVSAALDGWGRFTQVDAPEKADLVVSISSPQLMPDMGVASPIRDYPQQRRSTDQPVPTSKSAAPDPVELMVYDAKTKKLLWKAAHRPAYAIKQKARETNLVQAAEIVFKKLHDRVEPPPAP